MTAKQVGIRKVRHAGDRSHCVGLFGSPLGVGYDAACAMAASIPTGHESARRGKLALVAAIIGAAVP